MATLRQVRAFIESLPESTEQDHHGFPSFRVADKIFATLPDPQHLHIMLDEPEVQMAVALGPDAIEELRWGSRLAGVRVSLAGVSRDLLSDLVLLAWQRKAPRRLRLPPSTRG